MLPADKSIVEKQRGCRVDRATWIYLHTLCLQLGQQRLQLLAQLPGGQIRKVCKEHCQAHMVWPIGLHLEKGQIQALRSHEGSLVAHSTEHCEGRGPASCLHTRHRERTGRLSPFLARMTAWPSSAWNSAAGADVLTFRDRAPQLAVCSLIFLVQAKCFGRRQVFLKEGRE